MILNNKYVIAVLSGVLMVVAFPPMPLFLFGFIAFVPILYIFLNRDDIKHPFFIVYITFFVYHFGTNWWIPVWQPGKDIFLMLAGGALCFIHPFFFLVPFAAYFYISSKIGRSKAVWAFPFIFTSFEWLHSLSEFSYPWLTFGTTQVYNSTWLQFVDITGVFGASFLILLINVLVLKIIENISQSGYKIDIKLFLSNTRIRNYSVTIFLILLVPYVYGLIQKNNYEHKEMLRTNDKANIGIVQPNINPWKKWDINAYQQLKLMQSISDSLLGKNQQLDLILWPETSITFLSEAFNAEHRFGFFKKWIETQNIGLMTGFSDILIYDDPSEAGVSAKPLFGDTSKMYDSYNSALLLEQGTAEPQIYHKMKLTPFAERIPHQEIFGAVFSFIKWGVGISAWGKGTEQKNLTFTNQKGQEFTIAPVICIESIYPSFVSDYSQKGADIYSVITNDGWYDYTAGPEQHYLISVIRAIENRRYLARCANTGVSGFIAPTGETLLRAPEYKATGIALSIPKIRTKTLYAQLGDWLPIGSTIFVVGFIAFLRFRKKLV